VLIGFVSDIVAHVRRLFDFPDPVNETSARLVAAFVVLEAILFLVFREGWVLVPLTYGFLARVATGPTLSPLGQFVTRFATPRVESVLTRRNPEFRSRQVPGPPKRFAQSIGLGFTAAASIAWMLDAPAVALVLIAMLAVAATLEAAFAICLGCIAYSAIWGCADCNDISDRLRRAVAEAREESTAPSTGAVNVSEAAAPAMR
jgi:cytochrome c biogenesis protein CcdA